MRVIVQGRLKQRQYETREGEKRTVFELDVDEVGPSLKYATAKVTRTTRSGGGGGYSGGGGRPVAATTRGPARLAAVGPAVRGGQQGRLAPVARAVRAAAVRSGQRPVGRSRRRLVRRAAVLIQPNTSPFPQHSGVSRALRKESTTMAKAVMRKPKKKVCQFCKEKATGVDYKDTTLLRKFISDRGKIRARRVTGNCVQHQRDVAIAVKNAREMALLPYTSTGR